MKLLYLLQLGLLFTGLQAAATSLQPKDLATRSTVSELLTDILDDIEDAVECTACEVG